MTSKPSLARIAPSLRKVKWNQGDRKKYRKRENLQQVFINIIKPKV